MNRNDVRCRMFFRSILPNFNPADPLQPGLPEGADGAVGGAGQGADLRNSVNSLLDAMRDLLGNLQLPEVNCASEFQELIARRFQWREMTRQMTPRREIPKSGTRL